MTKIERFRFLHRAIFIRRVTHADNAFARVPYPLIMKSGQRLCSAFRPAPLTLLSIGFNR